jgi:Tol biopolymer transport system component
LLGTVYLYFPPKTEYDQREYPYRGNVYRVNPSTGQADLLLTSDVQYFATSPDGDQLAYVVREAEGDQLSLRNLADAKDAVVFAGQAQVRDPAWSPDGRELAYVLRGVNGSQLLVRKLANGKEATLSANLEQIVVPIWSPDGRELAFTQWQEAGTWWNTSEVWVVSVEDRAGRKVANGFDPAWSPNGQQLAYVTRPRVGRYEQNSLEIVDRFGKNPHLLLDTDPQTWKPGQGIDFDPEYGRPVLTNPSWSSDGSYLLFNVTANPVGLYRIQPDSGEVLKLISSRLAACRRGNGACLSIDQVRQGF